MVTVAIVHKCTILHPLMWVFFCSNCAELTTFFILHNYTSTDVITLPPYISNSKIQNSKYKVTATIIKKK